MVVKMLMKTAFLLLAVGVLQVPSEYIEPKFLEDVIKEESASTAIHSRIVSGWEAKLGQFPHHANLRAINPVGGISSCGGSIVHREWMITAAHCTAGRTSFVVRAGLVSLTEPEYIFETTQFWNYPSYDNSQPTLVQPNDIGIMKLGHPVTFSENIKPIRIQSTQDAFKDYDGLVLETSGHGLTWTGGSSPENLRWVFLRGLSNNVCVLQYGTILINSNAICAQWYNVTSQSTCQGDSGGPLMYVNEENEHILVGVTSFVAGVQSGGCHSGMPAGFVRPGPFHKWFTEVSGIDFENLEEDEEPTTPYAPTTVTDESEEDEVQTTVLPPTESEEESSSEEEVTEAPSSSEEDSSDSSDSSESDEDVSELLKRLQIKVKVKVKINKFKKKVIVKKP